MSFDKNFVFIGIIEFVKTEKIIKNKSNPNILMNHLIR